MHVALKTPCAYILFLFLALAFTTTIQGQTPPPEQEIVSEEPSEADLDRIEQWQDYLAHPIDLNTASLTLLRSLPFLREGEPEALIAFRERYQTFSATTDLFWVENLSHDRASELLPFFCVKEPLIGRFHKQQAEVLQRVSYRAVRGVKTKKDVLGNPLALETRLDYRAGDALRIALRGRTLPYEPFGTRVNPYGYASYAGFGQITFEGESPARLVVGHFSYLAGYGLTFSSSRYAFPSQRVLSPQGDRYLPRGCFATPTSATPFGVAVTSRLGRLLLLTVGLSYRPVNASYREVKGARRLRTVDISGAFDTPSRQKWRNATRESLALFDLKLLRQRYALGLAGVYDHFRDPFLASTSPELKLQTQLRLGIYGLYRWRRLQLWGELAEGGLHPKTFFGKKERANGWAQASTLLAADYKTTRYGSWAVELYRYGQENASRYQRNFSRASHPRGRYGGNLYYHLWMLQGMQLSAIYRFHHSGLEKAWRHELALAADVPLSAGRTLLLRYKTYYREPVYAARHDLKVRFAYPLSHTLTASSLCQLALGNQRATRRFVPPSFFFAQRIDYRAHWITLSLFAAGFYGGKYPAVIYYGEPSFRYTSPIHSVRRTGGRAVLLSRFRLGDYWALGFRLGATFETSPSPSRLAAYDAQVLLSMAWR